MIFLLSILMAAPSLTATPFVPESEQAGLQLDIHVLVSNSATDAPVANASVTNASTGETVYSNAVGIAVFSTQEYPSHQVTLIGDHADFVSRFTESFLPDEACSSNCGPVYWSIELALDPNDFVISPPIGVAGFQYSQDLPTGIQLPGGGGQYLQSISADIPANAWSGSYRVGFTPIRYNSLHHLDNSGVTTGAPIGGFSFRFLDPSTMQAVPGVSIAEPITLDLDPCYVMDLATVGRTLQAYRVDQAGIGYSSIGVVSTQLINGRIHVEVNEAGTYQVFASNPIAEVTPQGGSEYRWEFESFKWRTGCSITSTDPNRDLPIFGCTTYTDGLAEPFTIGSTEKKETRGHWSLEIEAETVLKIFGSGVKVTGNAQGGADWTSTSTWTEGSSIGTRVFSDPKLCGEVCQTVKVGILVFKKMKKVQVCECPTFEWQDTGIRESHEIWGPPCTDDSDLEPCDGED